MRGWSRRREVASRAQRGRARVPRHRPRLKGVDHVLLSAAEIAEALDGGRLHIGVTRQDLVREASRSGQSRSMSCSPGLRLRRSRHRGAGVLARRHRDGRSRRRGEGYRAGTAAGSGWRPSTTVWSEPSSPATVSPTIGSSTAGRDRRLGPEPLRRSGRGHHHHRLDAARQSPAPARRRVDPPEPGDALRLAPRVLDAAGHRGTH